MSWYFKELFILALYIPLLLIMVGHAGALLGDAPLPLPLPLLLPRSLVPSLRLGLSARWARAAAALLAGALLQSFSFCTLHDASHYGLLFKVTHHDTKWRKQPYSSRRSRGTVRQ